MKIEISKIGHSKMRICHVCNGTGHDPDSRPKVELRPVKDIDGRERKKHITHERGSGCYECFGRGVINAANN